MQIDLGDPLHPKYVNIYTILSILKKLQKKSIICNNIYDIECLSLKFDI